MVVVQLIHRLTWADISCTTMAHLFFFPLLDSYLKKGPLDSEVNCDESVWREMFAMPPVPSPAALFGVLFTPSVNHAEEAESLALKHESMILEPGFSVQNDPSND